MDLVLLHGVAVESACDITCEVRPLIDLGGGRSVLLLMLLCAPLAKVNSAGKSSLSGRESA